MDGSAKPNSPWPGHWQRFLRWRRSEMARNGAKWLTFRKPRVPLHSWGMAQQEWSGRGVSAATLSSPWAIRCTPVGFGGYPPFLPARRTSLRTLPSAVKRSGQRERSSAACSWVGARHGRERREAFEGAAGVDDHAVVVIARPLVAGVRHGVEGGAPHPFHDVDVVRSPRCACRAPTAPRSCRWGRCRRRPR